MVETHEVVCDFCGGSNTDFLFDARDRLYGCEGVFTYVKCRNCGLVYMNPQISPDEIGKFYPDDYAPHRSKVEHLRAGRNSQIVRLKNAPVVRNLRNIRKQFLDNVKIVSSVRRKLNKQSKILDVGCGSGKFLNQIRNETGCQVYGVDISESAVTAAAAEYGIDVFKGYITEAPFPPNFFDIITAWWSLEHVPNPSEVLQKMHNLLKYDGFCIIGVPNIDSFNGRIFKDKWYHLDCPRHLHIYSPDTITKLLNKTGFVVTRIVFGKTAWGLFHSLRYYFGNDNIPLKQRKRLKYSSLLKRLLLPWTVLLALLKQSDIIIVYARKKPAQIS
jgi:2-polyprenyl-3-methyl-5-hydroxy-6-metoxy-1,4-benzoquinol methylase